MVEEVLPASLSGRDIVLAIIRKEIAKTENKDESLKLGVDGGNLFNRLYPAEKYLSENHEASNDRIGAEAVRYFARFAMASARKDGDKETERKILDLFSIL